MRIAILAALALPLPALAQPVVRLNELEEQALRQRPALAVTDAAIRRARAGLREADARRYPTLALSGETTLQPGGDLITFTDPETGVEYQIEGSRTLEDSDAFLPNFRYGVGLSIRSTLYDFGRTAAAEEAARASLRVSRAEQRAAREQIVQAVRVAYMRWLLAYELAAVANRTADEARARMARVSGLIEEGARPESDLALVRSDAALSRLEAARAQGDLARARVTLEETVGRELPGDGRPDPGQLSVEPAAPRGTDPELAAALRRREAARAAVRLHDRRFLPILSAAADAGVRGQSSTLFPTYRASIGISLPLWDGGTGAALEDQARADATGLGAQAERLRADRDAARARVDIDRRTAEEELTIAHELEQAARTRLAQAEERYDLGAGSIEAIADARVALHRALTEVLQARVARALALLQLARP